MRISCVGGVIHADRFQVHDSFHDVSHCGVDFIFTIAQARKKKCFPTAAFQEQTVHAEFTWLQFLRIDSIAQAGKIMDAVLTLFCHITVLVHVV